jgi:hypothetical protein
MLTLTVRRCGAVMGLAEDSALLEAVKGGDVAAVRAALDAGADLECTDETVRWELPRSHKGLSPRADAACRARRRRAQKDQTPLGLAADKGLVDVLRLLIQRGAKVGAKSNVRPRLRCRAAAPRRHADVHQSEWRCVAVSACTN